MALWSVMSVTGRSNVLNDATNLGANFYVTFRIKYTQSTFGAFIEPPIMAWDEVIMKCDYTNRQYNEFIGNMYTHKPASPTVAVWAQRYFRAYLHAKGLPYNNWKGDAKGHSKLFDKNNSAVPGTALPNAVGLEAQNKAVQNYLNLNGGILEIEVHDIPSFIKPTTGIVKNIERILTFNCGVTGMGPRVKAYQHLKLDSTQAPNTWTNVFVIGGGNPPGVRTTGLEKTVDFGISGPNDTMPEGGIR